MKKSRWILVGVLAVVVATYIWMINQPSETPQEPEQAQIPLFGIDQSRIQDIVIRNQNDHFELTLVDGVWYFKDDMDISVIQPKADGLAYDLSSIVAERLVEENATDLAQYGLDPAVSVVMARLTDGTEHVFYVGNRVQDAMEYYFKTGNDNNVYTVYIGKGQMFTSVREDFKDKNLTTVSQDQIQSITIKANNKPAVTVEQNFQEDGAAVWKVTEPFVWNASTSLVQSEILSRLTGLTAVSFVTDKTMEEMGLDQPLVVATIKKLDGTEVRYQIGGMEGENCYMLVDGVKEPALVSSAVSLLSKVEGFTVCERLLYTPNIEDVSSVIVKGENSTIKLSAQQNEDAMAYELNNREVTEELYSSLYSEVISLKIDQVSSRKLTNKSGLYLKYTMTDGTVKQFDFYVYDDRNYGVTMDGEHFFLIRKQNFDVWFETVSNTFF